MTKPLALILYEHLLPGSQLVNRLQDLGYRVQNLADGALLLSQAVRERPLLILLDLAMGSSTDGPTRIRDLRKHPDTRHIPVIAFGDPADETGTAAATAAGATLVAGSSAILDQLPQLLEQALQVE